MTRKITMKALKPLDGVEQDFAALADQWIDRNWYLPPGGDHSWREREAQRIFGGVGKEPINDKGDPPPPGQAGPTAGEADGRYEPGFRRIGALNVALPIALATCAMLLVVVILAPEILTSNFWDPREPKALSGAPARMIKEAAAENVTPSPAYVGGFNRDKGEFVSQTLHQQVGQAAAPAKVYRKMVLPLLRPQMPVTTRRDGQGGKLAVHVAKAQSPRPAQSPRKLTASPIGAAYFANHAPVAVTGKLVAVPSRPIGEAYFESHSPAAAD